jgi:UDP-N-acetylglucosamine:LPS N-acetylglucosamine transferase
MRILAIASIGGHWIQLLRLMPLFNEHEVTFVSTNANLKHMVDGHKFITIPDANRTRRMDLVKCILSVTWHVVIARPKVVISTGAAPGLIGISIGKLIGAKTIWIDSIANAEKLSMSGHIATKIADRVYTQWAHLANSKVIYQGNIL